MRAHQLLKQAAAVILIRPTGARGFEVFLARLPNAQPFLGGRYCFPGGPLRKADCSSPMRRRCHGLTPAGARKILGAHLAPGRALGFWIAGIRELFEKVGMLLAVDREGHAPKMESKFLARIAEKRAALIAKTLSFQSFLESEDLFCHAACLAYFSHWQTPSQVAAPVDTRFFMAALPSDQNPLCAAHEVAQNQWLTPDRGLRLFDRQELPMTFAAFASLRSLADYDSFDSVARDYRLKTTICL